MAGKGNAFARAFDAWRWAKSERVGFSKFDLADGIGVSAYSAARLLREMHRAGLVVPMREPRPGRLTEWMSL